MIRRPPRSTRTDTLFPTRRSSDLTDIGGGSDGIYLYFRPELRLGDMVLLNIDSPYSFYLFTLGCLLITWIFLAVLMRSRFGAALTGIDRKSTRLNSSH